MPLLKREPQVFPEHLFELSTAATPWSAVYVRARQEKKLARHLAEHHVPHYLPQQESAAQRAGRRRVSFLPLFPGYVFLRGGRAERLAARQSNLVVHVLDVLDQPQLDAELRSLWRLQQSGLPLVPHPYLGLGDAVEVRAGPFQGYRGEVLRTRGALRLVVTITFLRRCMAVELDREAVQPLPVPSPRPIPRAAHAG